MKQEYSRVHGGIRSRGLFLRCFWQVEADTSYDVVRGASHWSRLIVIRTILGEGEITLVGGKVFSLGEGSLFFLIGSQLQRYRCSAASWHFCWFELDAIEPLGFALHTVYAVGKVESELELYALVKQGLRRSETSFQQVAVAALSLLVAHWEAQWLGELRPLHPHQETVERVVALMRSHLDGSVTVPAMAAIAHLSEPQFRRVFRSMTGRSPKDYYEALRLEHGQQLLIFNRWSVRRVAEELGYSSMFHFSRTYKNHYGCAPSTLSVLAADQQAILANASRPL